MHVTWNFPSPDLWQPPKRFCFPQLMKNRRDLLLCPEKTSQSVITSTKYWVNSRGPFVTNKGSPGTAWHCQEQNASNANFLITSQYPYHAIKMNLLLSQNGQPQAHTAMPTCILFGVSSQCPKIINIIKCIHENNRFALKFTQQTSHVCFLLQFLQPPLRLKWVTTSLGGVPITSTTNLTMKERKERAASLWIDEPMYLLATSPALDHTVPFFNQGWGWSSHLHFHAHTWCHPWRWRKKNPLLY